MAAFNTGGGATRAMIIAAVAAIVILTVMNIKYLLWNFAAYADFKKTQAYTDLMNSNAEMTTLAMPLALAMTVNVAFIVGLVFVPACGG